MGNKEVDQYSEQETQRRVEAALRGAPDSRLRAAVRNEARQA